MLFSTICFSFLLFNNVISKKEHVFMSRQTISTRTFSKDNDRRAGYLCRISLPNLTMGIRKLVLVS